MRVKKEWSSLNGRVKRILKYLHVKLRALCYAPVMHLHVNFNWVKAYRLIIGTSHVASGESDWQKLFVFVAPLSFSFSFSYLTYISRVDNNEQGTFFD